MERTRQNTTRPKPKTFYVYSLVVCQVFPYQSLLIQGPLPSLKSGVSPNLVRLICIVPEFVFTNSGCSRSQKMVKKKEKKQTFFSLRRVCVSAWVSVGLPSCLDRALAHRIRGFLACLPHLYL